MKIYYTSHADNVISKREIKESQVEELVKSPPQVLEGKGETKIAQGIYQRNDRDFLLRVVYKEEKDIIKVITSYWTSKIEKYWEEKP